MRLYVASSWRCELQPYIVTRLRLSGHDVYDFRHPKKDDYGFSWGDIAANWKEWSSTEFIVGLKSTVANGGFKNDFDAMQEAEGCVLVLPCGRSAHLEAGWFVGANKPLWILLDEKSEPELMYKMATGIFSNIPDLLNGIQEWEHEYDQT